jgi:hypothetical protein
MRRLGAAVELHECGDQTVKLPRLDSLLLDRAFEGFPLIEPAHNDQPIDDYPIPAEGKPAMRGVQRHYVQIDIRGEAAIETEFGAARGLAPSERREIEIGKTDGLLQLVDAIADHKDP